MGYSDQKTIIKRILQMSEKDLTLNDWMTKNRWTNTAMAKALTKKGHPVSHSMIRQVRHKETQPSVRLANEIWIFTSKQVALEEICNLKKPN